MANQFVQVPPQSTGLKMQTFENTVGANLVESEAVTLVRSSDNTEVGTSGQPLRVDPVGTTTQPVSGTVTANQGGAPWTVIGNVTDGSTTETNILVVGGESNDATAQYQPVPLGTAGRSVIVEGVAGGTTVPVSGTVSVTNFANPLPVSESGTWTNRIVGNGGATLDQANGSAVPTNGVMVGGGSVAGGTNFTSLTVKAASTAAAATDTSLVVQPLVGSAVMSTAASGVQRVGIAGSGNAVLDAVITAATAPANAIATLAVNNTTAPSLTTGQSVAAQADYQGNLYVTPYRRSNTAVATGTFTSASATTLLAAQAAGIFSDLGSISITQGLGTTANVYFSVNVSDGTATYKFNMFSNDSVSVTPTGSQPISMTFTPPIKATTAATAWTVALSSATDAPTVNVTATFWLQKAS